MLKPILTVTLGALVASASACGEAPRSSSTLPLLTPPVDAAAPELLRSGLSEAARALASSDVAAPVDVGELRERFFDAHGGPTNIYRLLADVDDQLTAINARIADGDHPCVSADAVAYNVDAFGDALTFWTQCSVADAGGGGWDDGLLQFGVHDGKTYIYRKGGAMRLAAIVTPTEDPNAKGDALENHGHARYRVELWFGVGYGNAAHCGTTSRFDGCTYGVGHLLADESTHTFELAVAGLGMGYCGAQLASDGDALRSVGSTDMGASCVDARSFCVDAHNLRTEAGCGASTEFSLRPLGRLATDRMGQSAYPAAPDVFLDGSDADDLAFGPLAPTPGSGAF